MAEERNLATVRAPEADNDEDTTKAELQRRMEEARESITQTVTEIKDTVMNQYQAVKESLDWREQYRRRPVAWSIGATAVGFLVGYTLMGAFSGDDDEEGRASGYPTYSESDVWNITDVEPVKYERAAGFAAAPSAAASSYSPQATTGSSPQSHAPAQKLSQDFGGSSAKPLGANMTYEAGEQKAAEEEEVDKGPGIIERFKGTKAYDRLEQEVSSLGDRFLEELSKTAQTVVLPALFNKIKELVGVDLSNKQSQGSARSSSGGASSGSTASSGGTARANAPAPETSYGTSQNQGYGTQHQSREQGQQSQSAGAGTNPTYNPT